MPVALRFPSAASPMPAGRQLYSMSDAATSSPLVEAARPCFLALVAAGTIEEFEVPAEFAQPECFEGRNWYKVFDDPEYDERVTAPAPTADARGVAARSLGRRMKTRTLLLLALGCGVAIMLAGGVLLVQLVGQDDAAPPVPLGVEAPIGDMRDHRARRRPSDDGVLDVDRRRSAASTTSTARPVPLIASGPAPMPRRRPASTCGATTVEPRRARSCSTCRRRRRSRVLFYERGDEQAHWDCGG